MQTIKPLHILFIVISLFFISCTDSESDTNSENCLLEYEDLCYYQNNMDIDSYKLDRLTDDEFNKLSKENRYIVANKILTTLFYGYPKNILEEKIESGDFISSLVRDLNSYKNNIYAVEEYIRDKNYFYQDSLKEVNRILSRFFAMEKLDRYFFNNWISYILTQTIMFTPAYELETTHSPNITTVYSRIVKLLEESATMQFITYEHMTSSENWRRFRSPEDNGREMLEIFTLDFNDSDVPIAGKALQNWKLDRDNDTLVIDLNENRDPLTLFSTTIYNGYDFYLELVKSSEFTYGATSRLVDFFFLDMDGVKKDKITQKIIGSNPATWQDILLQIILSKEYLLNSTREKSAEELYYSLLRKMSYKHKKSSFNTLRYYLEDMHQASLKYKLGKLDRVPLDTLSFANYHKFIREHVVMRRLNPEKKDNYDDWDSYGWRDEFINRDFFDLDEENHEKTLESFLNYIFTVMIYRLPQKRELEFFKSHMLQTKDGKLQFLNRFNPFVDNSRDRNITILVLDYISRLEELYRFKGVN